MKTNDLKNFVLALAVVTAWNGCKTDTATEAVQEVPATETVEKVIPSACAFIETATLAQILGKQESDLTIEETDVFKTNKNASLCRFVWMGTTEKNYLTVRVNKNPDPTKYPDWVERRVRSLLNASGENATVFKPVELTDPVLLWAEKEKKMEWGIGNGFLVALEADPGSSLTLENLKVLANEVTRKAPAAESAPVTQ